MTDARKAASNAEVESAALVDGLHEQESVSRAPQAPQGDGVVEALRNRLDACPRTDRGLAYENNNFTGRRARLEVYGEWAKTLMWVIDNQDDLLAALAPKEGAPAADMGRSAIDIAMAGYQKWAEKPHNAKWVRKIDGTPIPNDLPVCIANEFAVLAPVHSSLEPSREPEAYLIENVMVPTAPFAPRDTTLTNRDWLYPARRADDAREAAKMLRGDLIPLYRSKGAAPFLPAQAAEPVAVTVLPTQPDSQGGEDA